MSETNDGPEKLIGALLLILLSLAFGGYMAGAVTFKFFVAFALLTIATINL